MEEFMKVYNLKILLKGSICFRNSDKRTCISLILINKSKSFQAIQIIETGISDFHRMVMTVLKVYFKKKGPSVIQYCDYKIFSNEKRRNDLFNKLIDLNLKPRGLIFLLIQYWKFLVKMLLLKSVMLEQMKLLSWTIFWKKQLSKDHNLGTFFWKKEHLKVKLHIINKATIVLGSYAKKSGTILKILTLQKFLTIRCSGKLWSPCSQTNVLTERAQLL